MMKVILLSERGAPRLFPNADCVFIRTIAELEAHRGAALYVDLDFSPEEARLSALRRMLPAAVMVNAVVHTTAEIGRPFIRINGWPGLAERTMHELAVSDGFVAAQVGELYDRLGCAFRLAPDIPGMVTARILAAIINEAWYTWQDGVSSKEEIDTAMKLGTNYPMGPFEWGEHIGLRRIVGLLDVLGKTDPRYIPAESLKKASEGIKI
jgi:3-hydroxybutyryl-CoA dehydrogenase